MMATALPWNVAVMISPTMASEIASAVSRRRARASGQEARTRAAGDVLLAVQHLADRHVMGCRCSYSGHSSCRALRDLKREIGRAEHRYRRELRRLRGGS